MLSNRVVQLVRQLAVYTIQLFVKPVVKRVWQPVECLYTRYNRLSNRFDNRLYRINGAYQTCNGKTVDDRHCSGLQRSLHQCTNPSTTSWRGQNQIFGSHISLDQSKNVIYPTFSSEPQLEMTPTGISTGFLVCKNLKSPYANTSGMTDRQTDRQTDGRTKQKWYPYNALHYSDMLLKQTIPTPLNI